MAKTLLYQKKSIENKLYKKIIQLKFKRLADILLSLICIIVFSPVFLFVSMMIKATSRGPIFYTNKRIGLFGDHFACFKFRSMICSHSYSQNDLAAFEQARREGKLYKIKNDNRVTFIGKIIRKTSIDELPQLFNVLKGDMSIVGPRPLVPHMLNNLDEFNEIRSLLKPGITGKWQTENRINNTSALHMMEHDIKYVEMFSLLSDLKIILKTPKVVLSTKGAF